MRICLICYARLLNNQFRDKLVSTTDSERERPKQW
jgi:hypothetical protein